MLWRTQVWGFTRTYRTYCPVHTWTTLCGTIIRRKLPFLRRAHNRCFRVTKYVRKLLHQLWHLGHDNTLNYSQLLVAHETLVLSLAAHEAEKGRNSASVGQSILCRGIEHASDANGCFRNHSMHCAVLYENTCPRHTTATRHFHNSSWPLCWARFLINHPEAFGDNQEQANKVFRQIRSLCQYRRRVRNRVL